MNVIMECDGVRIVNTRFIIYRNKKIKKGAFISTFLYCL
ncbi:hypothetical protein FORC087_3655 [Bacillus cereus]|nr:hypothetical protein FORC087_3655 [Bacillus cereus]